MFYHFPFVRCTYNLKLLDFALCITSCAKYYLSTMSTQLTHYPVTISSVPGDKSKACVTYDKCMDVWPEVYSIAGAALALDWDENTVKDAIDMNNVELYTLKSPYYDLSSQQSIQGGESCLVYRNTSPSIQTDQ